MIKKLDARVERFAYANILLQIDLVLGDSPDAALFERHG
jgi:hypothetical protein